MDLNHRFDQMDQTEIFRTFLPTVAEYTFLSIAYTTFSGKDQMIGYKIHLCKFKRTEIMPTYLPILPQRYENKNTPHKESWKTCTNI